VRLRQHLNTAHTCCLSTRKHTHARQTAVDHLSHFLVAWWFLRLLNYSVTQPARHCQHFDD